MIKQDSWIVDSGVANHIYYSLNNFISTKLVSNYFVQLPNNRKAVVTHIGMVKLTSLLTLKNVLCVPRFKFNLIFVNQLISSKKTYVLFTSMYYIVQDIPLCIVTKVTKASSGLIRKMNKACPNIVLINFSSFFLFSLSTPVNEIYLLEKQRKSLLIYIRLTFILCFSLSYWCGWNLVKVMTWKWNLLNTGLSFWLIF